jgi:hypothetical protein
MILNSNYFKHDYKLELNLIIKFYTKITLLLYMSCFLGEYIKIIFVICLMWLIGLKMMSHLNYIECSAVGIDSSDMSCVKSVPTRGCMCLSWSEFLEIAFSCESYVKENVSFELLYQNVYYCSK